jgi:hypothetical protein
MHMRIAWGSIVGWGMVGALLWAGHAGAQQPPGGLPACQASLKTCQTNLGKCNMALTVCEAEPDVVFPGDGVDGPALSYHDNGDGTFTDNNTLLMWEKKDITSGSIHDLSNTYTWSNAFAVFLAALNSPPCFAGHCDWRLPNVKELQSIVDYSKRNPAANVPGFTPADSHWSSTPFADDSVNAWDVNFTVGSVSPIGKNSALRVRAVRGGR